MKEKKESASWIIAIMHSVFVILLSMVVGWLSLVLMNILFDNLALDIADFIIVALVMWLSTAYSAKYVSENYIIRDSRKVMAIAMVCLIVFSVLDVFSGLAADRPLQQSDFNYNFSLASFVVGAIVNLIVFYLVSKKYIKNSEEITTPQQ